ncbi:putative tetratricopeptide-like helical domain superfamily [Septoria linicola]|nr:putative tetratricopeptide-like helical domain superfamily [Septoria linicola]
MSRIVPLLRHSPAASATTITPPTIAQTTRCIRPWIATRRHGRRGVATDKNGRRDDLCERPPRRRQPTRTFEDVFISSLVAAGTCRRHRKTSQLSQQSRSFCSGRRQQRVAVATPNDEFQISQKEYLKLVDFYVRHDRKENKAVAEKHHTPLASRLFMTPEQEQAEEQRELSAPYSRDVLVPEDQEQRKVIEALEQLISARLGTVSLEDIWSLYQSIHAPRTVYLHDKALRRLLQHLGFVEHWHEKNAMQRYFQLLDDCVAAGVPVNKHDWTTAITYAGRWIKHTTSKEVKGAIETWMRMEDAGHAADHVTLNVLFDVAVKAGRFALADTIYKEIRARNMPLDRYFRATLIYYAGMKRDGDDVRRAFREFVAAGEIVDTTIMNAVILSLLRAGEAAAAEQVFKKMKRLGEEKFSVRSPEDWVERRELRSELALAAHRLRAEKEFHESSFFGAPFSSEERREQVQKLSPVAPDSYTYMVLLQYHANTSGDIERIWQLLQEMGEQGLRPHTAAYMHILKGFRKHGGYAFSGWSHRRLEVLWKVIVNEMEVDVPAGALELPETATAHAVVDATQHSTNMNARPLFEAAASADSGWNADDWTADDASQFGISDNHNMLGTSAHDATLVPLAGIVRSAPRPQSQHEADDFDMLGAMIFEQARSSEINPGNDGSAVEDDVMQSSSPTRSRIGTSASFLESVSLKNLTDAALLPEGGSQLEDASQPEANNQSSVPSLPEIDAIKPFKHAGVDLNPEQKPSSHDAPSLFLDSFSLRHLTDAALLPEGGTPLEEVNAAQKHSISLDNKPNYVPLSSTDVKPKVTVVADPSTQSDDFDSHPIWRRDRDEDFRRRNNTSLPHIGQRPKLAPGQKPVAFTASMALEAVRAFYQCCGRDRMLQVWEDISAKWLDATEQERTRVANEVGQMVRHAGRYEDLDRASR